MHKPKGNILLFNIFLSNIILNWKDQWWLIELDQLFILLCTSFEGIYDVWPLIILWCNQL